MFGIAERSKRHWQMKIGSNRAIQMKRGNDNFSKGLFKYDLTPIGGGVWQKCEEVWGGGSHGKVISLFLLEWVGKKLKIKRKNHVFSLYNVNKPSWVVTPNDIFSLATIFFDNFFYSRQKKVRKKSEITWGGSSKNVRKCEKGGVWKSPKTEWDHIWTAPK